MKNRMLAIALMILILLPLLYGCGKSDASSKKSNTDEIIDSFEDSFKNAEKETATIRKDIEVQAGERQYSGSTSTDNISSIAVSFVLSEDKSSIHDFNISVKGFKGEAEKDGKTVSVEMNSVNTSVNSSVSIDYEGENRDITRGDSTIESLRFNDDGTAELVLTYRVKQTNGFDRSDDVEIPVTGIRFELTSKQK